MIAHRFAYRAPETLDAALALLAEHGAEASVMAGGTWLVPNMTHAVERPAFVLDARHLGLDGLAEDGEEVVLGAFATYGRILASDLARAAVPVLHAMAGQITGGPQIVRRATAGGSACYGSPSSDVPACLVAHEGRMILRSVRGTRAVAARDFFRAPFETDRRPDEVLTEIRLRKVPRGCAASYRKLKVSTGSWPIVTAAHVARPLPGGRLAHRVAIGGANARPVLWEGESAGGPSRDELAGMAAAAAAGIDAEWADELAGPGYRRRAAPGVVLQALLRSLGPQ